VSDPHERAEQWLTFVRDFTYLDTTPLLERLATEPKLAEAIDVLIRRSSCSSDILTAVRDFCVQSLMGTNPPPAVSPHLQAKVGLSPYSVPYGMICAVLDQARPPIRSNRPLPQSSKLWQLRTDTWMIEPASFPFLRFSSDCLIITTNCRLILPPEDPNRAPDTDFYIEDTATNRKVLRTPLALLPEDIPLFYVAPPNTEFRISLRPRGDVGLIVWGWECRYLQ